MQPTQRQATILSDTALACLSPVETYSRKPEVSHNYVAMAYTVMAYIVMVYVVMAHVVRETL